MSLAYDPYPELHELVDRLRPDKADEARRTLLRFVRDDEPSARLRALPIFDGPEDLSERVDARSGEPHRVTSQTLSPEKSPTQEDCGSTPSASSIRRARRS